MRALMLAAVAIGTVGCAGNGEGLDQNGRPVEGGPPPLEPTFESIQANVFTPICTQCHIGANAPLGLRLDEASSYAMLVNTPSAEVPSLLRVRPGNPDLSYIVQKLQGTAAVGGRMPLNNPALPQATIDVIRQWIVDGAQAPASLGSTSPPVLRAVAPAADDILESAPREILVQASTELDVTRLTATDVVLMRSGHDGSFSEGNEVRIALQSIEVRSISPTVIAIRMPASEWVPDSYQLTIAGTGPAAVSDLGNRALGEDFVMDFELGGSL